MAMNALYFCFFLLFWGRYLPDGDHGDECVVPEFSFCVGAGIYLTVIITINAMYLCFNYVCGQVFT